MDSFSQGRCIAKTLSTGALLLGLVACAEPSNAHQEKAMQDVTSADLKHEQDRVAAISDAALPPGSAPMMTWDGYPALQPGPELSPNQLLEQVQAMVKAIRSYGDSAPSKVEQVLGVALPPDAKQERRGVTGRVGKGSYSWAVWKPYPESPGHIVELTLTPDACVAYDAIRAPLEASGFRVYVPTFGDDQRISFDTAVGPSLALFIAVTPDRRESPTCATVVSFELDRRDA
ncbi:hypothetical protein LN565_04965 [Xanthomonas euvesicatoria pv. euvesicatoria]|nr:hypothetical protein [Xanthomonas euvesicatoria]MCC8501647.1 hypothetical protein [Xanthomonas euvesicatoria pv. euvesicatoria]MCC8514924.1 hypothetical protein [Xanthomonas euvesicatoria pv. euvesicatoria]MCC8540450.1 hypothetical protein [Xanthomonas euvesicatoria pv. euvesicatoria]MCC8545266.1 hypothetical protein [Xanthomonas euvesicatoria pv. euvesicatoria]MCC8569640.1 hypothetical protein [Xanthomonas euvesicatoria pv. euvesicatoria]